MPAQTLMPQPEQLGASGSLGGAALAEGAEGPKASPLLLMLSGAMKEFHLSPPPEPPSIVGVMFGLNSGNAAAGAMLWTGAGA